MDIYRNSADHSPVLATLDTVSSLSRLGGDRQLYQEMLRFLLEDVPTLFVKLRAAICAQDSRSIQGTAHALKGLLLNVGGVRAARFAQSLEEAGRDCNLQQVKPLLEQFESELDSLTLTIHTYLDAAPEAAVQS